MAQICLVPPARVAPGFDHLLDDFELLSRSAETRQGAHTPTDNPAEADIVLFVGSRHALHADVRRHPFARAFPQRALLYDSADHVIPFLPGIYPSIEARHYDPRRVRSGFYLRGLGSNWIRPAGRPSRARYLFSFVGTLGNSKVRGRLAQLQHPMGLVRDTGGEPGRGYGQSAAVYADFQRTYAESLSESAFVLCPRGVGCGTVRLFETMRAGRVPVVISDAWVPSPGPDWRTCSVRVRESQVGALPSMLEDLRNQADDMGEAAREAWRRWFSLEQAFDTLSTWCAELVQSRTHVRGLDELLIRAQVLRPWYVRWYHLPRLKRALLTRLVGRPR